MGFAFFSDTVSVDHVELIMLPKLKQEENIGDTLHCSREYEICLEYLGNC